VSGARLLDVRGCLTDAGLDALQAASPGGAPAEVVTHLGKCSRCQNRSLARSAGYAPDAPRVKKSPPPMWRTALVIVLAILLVISAMMMLRGVR
jgi:cytochrome c-type biogenesis protein CcmH/NrfF